jgi:predicted lipid-binding transport protein (Tim44 family)
MYLLLQAAVAAVATSPPPPQPEGLSLGAWLGIIATGLSVGAMLVKFGELKANTANLAVNVERELKDIKDSMSEVLAFINASRQQRVSDAGWQERTTANLATAMKDAEQARDTAHSAREVATEALIAANRGKSS